MNKIKIIDLLNMISKGEEVPKDIRFDGELCSFDNENKDYYCEQYENIVWYLVDTRNNMSEVLDTEVEIIEEEKEIEHINIQYWRDDEYAPEERINVCMTTINELIDVVNELKRDKK